MTFDEAFDRLLGNEGGYTNNPSDPGGETQWGISKRSYPNVDIQALTKDDAKAIYKRDFWDRAHLDQVHAAIAFQLFDIAVNSGIENAVKMLQRAVKVKDDGDIGPMTISAVNSRSVTDVLMLLVAERLDFWRKLPTWITFGKGWAGRAATDLRYAAEDA